MKVLAELIIVEICFTTSVINVWNAITRLDEVKLRFFGDIESFWPELGFRTQFEVKVEERIFTHLCEITEVIPHKKSTYNW